MECDIIERLAIDKALGELNSDADALFDAYLAEHKEARGWARAMSQTCTQTRKAINTKTRPVGLDRQLPRVPFSGVLAWQTVGRWAAVILIALGIGATAGRWSKPQTSTRTTIVVRTASIPAPDGWKRVLSQPEPGFWETKAVAMLQPKSAEIPSVPPSHRGLWDRYRQPIKEWSYE